MHNFKIGFDFFKHLKKIEIKCKTSLYLMKKSDFSLKNKLIFTLKDTGPDAQSFDQKLIINL